ncbi:MAG: 50S ribosomal protein L15 [Clostridiales bacterium]|nr:50S ribosomal protein L15 [Clostridiales bacterium]
MRINELSPAENSKVASKRLGRGIGSGLGKTSGKGHKGQNARSGGGVRPGFEGGQMPITRRLPQRGFNNQFKKVFSVVNVEDLNRLEDNTVVTVEVLKQMNIISKIEPAGLKVLGCGNLSKALQVKAAKFSKSAVEKIEKAGGSVEVL